MANAIRRVLNVAKPKGFTSGLRCLGSQEVQRRMKSPIEPVAPSNETLTELVWKNLDTFADRTAAVCAITGRGYSFSQVYKMSMTFAASLRTKLNLRTHGTTLIALRNNPEFQIIFMGVVHAGGVASFVDPNNTAQNFKYQIELINAKLIITEKMFYPKIREALNALKTDVPIILTDEEGLPDGTIKFSEFATDFNVDLNCLKSVSLKNTDLVCLPFSSGTTGLPKAVMLSHRSIVNNVTMAGHMDYAPVCENYKEVQSVMPAVLPFYHIFGLTGYLINNVCFGTKHVTMPQFMPDVFLETLIKYRPDAMIAVPPLISFLGNSPFVSAEHLASFKDMVCGAAALKEEDVAGFMKKNRNTMIRQGYGLTETAGGVSLVLKRDSNTNKGNTVGTPLWGCDVKIVDTGTKNSVGKGKEGEIWLKGPFLMTGYYKNEQATEEALTDDGWLRTGDIGKFDEKYNLCITDRIKDLIKVKGYQVTSAELENIILTHPKVYDCAVVGVPHSKTGEAPKAFIVKSNEVSLEEEELMDFINSKLISYKHVKSVEFIDEIPKSPAGKILRKQLRKICV